MFNRKHSARTWGFRFSATDLVVVGIFLSSVVVLLLVESVFWWILAIVAVHFFLFCNVFRIARPRELTWAVLFVLNVGVWAWFDHLTWQNVLFCQLPFTFIFLLLEMRSPLYHGILANRLNPRLSEYLIGNRGT